MKPTLRTLLLCSSITGLFWISTGCQPKKADVSASFTEADSLTEIILNLQDSLLITWNQMISDDNAKIKAMQFLLHEIEVYPLGAALSAGGHKFEPGSSFYVPTDQDNYIMVRSVFEKEITYT
ncbi:MAG: hypothetical protein MUE95_12195, partial [Cyclobacteriaceae bacterium]|nr:hypothetical protein [Cyclobacteriaceae bacterium]